MKRLFPLMLTILWLSGHALPKTPVTFRHFDELGGLPSDQIRSFAVLDDGRMAIRIPNGLVVFDGSEFRLHHIDRSLLTPSDFNQKNIYPSYKDKNGRLWLKSPGALVCYLPDEERFVYNTDSLLRADYGVEEHVGNLFIDKDKDLWAVTSGNKLVWCPAGSGTAVVTARLDGEWGRTYGPVTEISGAGGKAVICTASGSMRTWDKGKRQFTGCDDSFKGIITDPDKKFRTGFDRKGRQWAMYDNRLYLKKTDEVGWETFIELSGQSNFFTTMAVSPAGDIWTGSSWSGLRIIDGETLEVREYRQLPLESGRLLSNDIQDIHIDGTGGVWIGTLWQGIAYHHPEMSPFRTIHTGISPLGQHNESVRTFTETDDGSILVGTSFNGIVRFDPSTGKLTPESPGLFPSDDVYMCFLRDSQGAHWVGTYNHGFLRIMPDGTSRRYNYDPSRPVNIGRSVFEDSRGNFWVSVNDKGIGRLDLATGNIRMLSDRHPETAGRKREFGMFELEDGSLCVFGEGGVMLYYPEEDRVFLPYRNGKEGHRFHVACNGALGDTRGLTWFATDGGLVVSDISRYDEEGYRPVSLTASNSRLPADYVSSIVEDKFGQIWCATAKGLARIIVRPAEGGDWDFDITPYSYGFGLNAGRITENAAFTDSSGNVWFGGFNGAVTFNPKKLSSLQEGVKSPLITSLSILGKEIRPGRETGGRIILDSSLLNGKEIKLRHNENFFSLKFSSLNFISGRQIHFKYRLKGYDPDWVEIGTGDRPEAAYTGVPPGKYTFEVLSAGIDGIWSETPAAVTVVVEPPFWKSWWAYAVYVLAALASAALCLKYLSARRKKKLAREAARRELLQREQLNQMKFQFFTNISHEFRTPLTLIMTPLSHILGNDSLPEGLRKTIGTVYANAENLLGQVNRLLDFRKLEMGGEKLNLSRCRVVQFVSYLIASFDNVCADKGISMTMESRVPEDTDVYLDTHKLRHILTNLYSNALKFTPSGGTIATVMETIEDAEGGGALLVTVRDNGCGIAPEDLPSVFDRFYQAGDKEANPSGSGIGLHLVREYVQLHGGAVSADSVEGEGTAFTFTIPLDLHPPKAHGETAEEAAKPTGTQAGLNDATPRILVVEDNAEFRDFLSEYLSPQYEVKTASDGTEGLEAARSWHPDIIVTDLMMPRMNGLQLTEAIKQDISTSHIPVILLTAKASDETRIESYRSGADSYISKPFNYDVLNARIATLLNESRKRKRIFRENRVIEPSAVTITSLDEKMVAKALETVEANMDNTAFSTVMLGEALGLSRSQLYRKFESVTGMSPADFITRMRLKRAAQLLADSKLNVSEIADMTGFNSIKYFNRHFKEEYNCTPTQYRASHTV